MKEAKVSMITDELMQSFGLDNKELAQGIAEQVARNNMRGAINLYMQNKLGEKEEEDNVVKFEKKTSEVDPKTS